MSNGDVIDRLIEAPVITSFSRIGCELRSRVDGWASLDGYDLRGQVIVVTGATSGVGQAAATQLARCGATLVLVGRSTTRNETAVSQMIEATANAGITAVAADVGDYAQVRALADRVLADYSRLDVLIHNAGALANERHETPDGTEATVASQVLGPFLLTGLLLERLTQSPPSRVLSMSSGGMYTAGLTVSELQISAQQYKGAEQYARAKRAQVTLNEMWADRFGHRGISFHSLHPGWVDTPGVAASLPRFSKLMRPLLRSPHQGADTLIWLAADDGALESNGAFWHDRRCRSTHKLRSTRKTDTIERRSRLWAWASSSTGLDLPAQ
jgi:dehydrogenase/reductase SDR family protein 12